MNPIFPISTTTCTRLDASTTNCITFDSASSSGNIITYHDWLFMSGAQLFSTSFLAVAILFSPLSRKRKRP